MEDRTMTASANTRLLQDPRYPPRTGGLPSASKDSMPVIILVFTVVVAAVVVICTILKRRRRRAQREARGQHMNDRASGQQPINVETRQAIRSKVIRTIFPPGVTAADFLEKTTQVTKGNDDATCDQDDSASFTASSSSNDDDSSSSDADSITSTTSELQQEQQQCYYDPESNSVVEEQPDTINSEVQANHHDERKDDDDDDEKRECSICLGDFEPPNDEVAKMRQCRHLFHRDCILEWSRRKSDCPICREEMWESSRFDRLEKTVAKQFTQEA